MRDRDLTSLDMEKFCCTTELMAYEWAPCRYACPVHADVRTYIELASQGRWKESVDVIRRHLPFAAVCGRICHHPCEDNCRRKDIDKPVAIREVKRCVAEHLGTDATVNKPRVQDKNRVAIIGAGPAGLSAALELARLGYRPAVFEKYPISGGTPATAIPRYRLPYRIVQIDVDWICAHGVDVRNNIEIGKDKMIEELGSEGFDAVLIATGLPNSRMLDIPGSDNVKVLAAMKFLTALALGEKPKIGKDVLIVGGGNVACDVARSAVRLGAERVRIMCLEAADEMPAWPWEIHEATEEGIGVINRRGPVEIITHRGRIQQVKARKVTRVFDENKRFSPEYDDGDVIGIDCDNVIFSVGQMPDYEFTKGSALKFDSHGRIRFNPATHQTNLENVFACGEIVTPLGSVVEACAGGRRAAKAIDMYLTGRQIEIDDSLPPEIEEIPDVTAEKVIKTERVVVHTEKPAERKKTFDEFERTLDTEAAAFEAGRCMNCGGGAEVLIDKCAACLTCLRVCPFDIPKVTDVARIDSAMCQACGICIAECPAVAIIARARDKDELKTKTAEALASLTSSPKAVAFICGHCILTTAWQSNAINFPSVAQFYLPSLAGLSVADILKAFESGADAVIVVAARQDKERYPQATGWIGRRVEQARRMIAEAGIQAERLKMVEVDGDTPSVGKVLAEFAEEL